jgi:prephenate dehydrogenase
MRWASTREPLEHHVDLATTSMAELRELGRRGEVVVGWA